MSKKTAKLDLERQLEGESLSPDTANSGLRELPEDYWQQVSGGFGQVIGHTQVFHQVWTPGFEQTTFRQSTPPPDEPH